MLTLIRELDPDTRLHYHIRLRPPLAMDLETGAQLIVSSGRRKAGRPVRCWVRMPGDDLPLPPGRSFTASSEAEALSKGRAVVERLTAHTE